MIPLSNEIKHQNNKKYNKYSQNSINQYNILRTNSVKTSKHKLKHLIRLIYASLATNVL